MFFALLLAYLGVTGWGAFVAHWDESTFVAVAVVGLVVVIAAGEGLRRWA